MISSGIHSLDQLKKKAHLGVLGERKEIALDLYDACSRLPDDQRNWMQEAVLRNASSATSAFKRTQSRRFETFDKQVSLELLKIKDALKRPVNVHDIGVSDGRTTAQFYHILERVFDGKFHLTASDLDIEFFSIALGKRRRGIFDSRGTCLQLVSPPFVFNLRAKPRSRFTIVNNIATASLDRFYGERLTKAFLSAPQRAFPFALLCKEFCDLRSSSSKIGLMQHDVLDPYDKDVFQIVRAMNILNKSYFSNQDLRKAIGNIHDSLCPEGAFITGSNQDAESEVKGGVYQKSGRSFKPTAEWGGGSPVRALLLSEVF